jgi:hypothetical protein
VLAAILGRSLKNWKGQIKTHPRECDIVFVVSRFHGLFPLGRCDHIILPL